MSPDRRRSLGELAAMFVTVALFLLFENVLHLKLQFLVPCIVAWTAYVAHRLAKERTLAAAWGIRLDNLKSAAPPILGFFALGAAALFAWRRAFGGLAIPAGAWVIFLLYPVWSFLQQFVLQALVASNLERLGMARAAVVPIAAALFGLAHLPDWPLAGLCAASGLAWTAIYLRWRHLPLLALTHAWLGALAFYWVLGRDPWGEMFNR
ncbi:MAG: CPBP family intramembrane metalloprotease [Planctomycetes bacterium]|nr:CPBP family intramembrane metalloprotease [Planctomycetota bacterium]